MDFELLSLNEYILTRNPLLGIPNYHRARRSRSEGRAGPSKPNVAAARRADADGAARTACGRRCAQQAATRTRWYVADATPAVARAVQRGGGGAWGSRPPSAVAPDRPAGFAGLGWAGPSQRTAGSSLSAGLAQPGQAKGTVRGDAA